MDDVEDLFGPRRCRGTAFMSSPAAGSTPQAEVAPLSYLESSPASPPTRSIAANLAPSLSSLSPSPSPVRHRGQERLHLDASVEQLCAGAGGSGRQLGALSSAALAASALMESVRGASGAGEGAAPGAVHAAHSRADARCILASEVPVRCLQQVSRGAARASFQAWLLWFCQRRRDQSRSVRAASLLARRDRATLVHECFMRWHCSTAEAHAMQVRMMRERLERADAECCALRGQEEGLRAEAQRWRAEAEEAQARTDWAEAELLRRTGHEFSRLRELQTELAHLQSEVALPKAGACNCIQDHHAIVGPACGLALQKPVEHVPTRPSEVVAVAKGGATAAAARGVAASLAAAAARVWLKLCLSAWSSQANAQSLALALVAQCAASEDATCRGQVLAAWRLAVRHGRLRCAAVHLFDTASVRQAAPLVRAVLRRWHAVVADSVGAVTSSLGAVSPLSGQTYCSAMMWSPAEKSALHPVLGAGDGPVTEGIVGTALWPPLERPAGARGSGSNSQRSWAEGLWVRPQQREAPGTHSALQHALQPRVWPAPAPTAVEAAATPATWHINPELSTASPRRRSISPGQGRVIMQCSRARLPLAEDA